jgi:hypothetical protein
VSDPIEQLRQNAGAVPAAPAAFGPYLEKVRDRAYTVTDEDVEALKRAGFSEDEIFVQTVGTAIRAGLRRLDAAERAIG